jgi:hypothetical protein
MEPIAMRRFPQLPAALVLLTLGATALLVGCCGAPRAPAIGPAHRLPPPSAIVLPTPAQVAAGSDSVTEVAIRGVAFHVDDDIRMGIRDFRGRILDLRGEGVVDLDDKRTLEFRIERADIALSAGDLTLLLNRYVFGYEGSPLRDLVVTTSGDRIVQTGVMHKVIDIPFTMTATLGVTGEGQIRIHSTAMEICGLDGKGLLKAVGASLEDVLDLRGAKGVRVEGNDLILDPLKILPPPKIAGRLTAIRVEGDEVVQTFGAAGAPGAESLPPPVAAEHYVFFRGGSLKFGKLFMVRAELEAIDGDPGDPFDFYLDYYATQLVAGYHVTLADLGLVTYMPDFDDLGTAKGKLGAPAR